MPNTKKLSPASRKAAKRRGRRELKELITSMTREERKAYRKEEKASLKSFVIGHRAAQEKAKAEAAAKAAEEAAAKSAEASEAAPAE